MHNPVYLKLSRHNIYYFRFPLPKPHNAKPEYVSVSLDTREPKKALELALSLQHHANLLYGKYGGMLMNYDNAKDIMREYFRKLLDEKKRYINDVQPIMTNVIAHYYDVIEKPEAFRNETASETKRIIADNGLQISEGTEDFETLHKVYQRGFREYVDALVEANKNRTSLGLRPSRIKTINQVKTITISEAAERLEKEAINDGRWTEKTADEFRGHIETLKEILGADFNVAYLDRDKARYVLDTIRTLPIRRNLDPRTRDLSLAEACKIEGIPKLSNGSVIKYINNYYLLFDWCCTLEVVSKNYFSGLGVKKDRNEDSEDGRIAFSPEQTMKIFDIMESKYKQIQDLEYLYWGTLIALYTGARRGEVAQLELSDIRQQDGIWYFDINDKGMRKKLKNKHSRRKIPITDVLIKKGLLEYKDKVEKLGETRLLYQLTYSKGEGYGKKLGEYFNENVLTELGIKDKDVVFHCTRHTFETRLVQSDDTDPYIITRLMGHAPAHEMMARYAKEGYLLKQLHNTINKLPY